MVDSQEDKESMLLIQLPCGEQITWNALKYGLGLYNPNKFRSKESFELLFAWSNFQRPHFPTVNVSNSPFLGVQLKCVCLKLSILWLSLIWRTKVAWIVLDKFGTLFQNPREGNWIAWWEDTIACAASFLEVMGSKSPQSNVENIKQSRRNLNGSANSSNSTLSMRNFVPRLTKSNTIWKLMKFKAPGKLNCKQDFTSLKLIIGLRKTSLKW